MISFPLASRSRYIFALLTALAGVASLVLFRDFFQRSPLTPAWCVSLLSLLVAGVAPAILAEAIIIVATIYLAIEPFRAMGLEVPGDGTRLAIWILCIGLADFLAWRLQSAHKLSATREKALRESELRYRDLLEQASDGIVLSERDGRFVMVNQRAARMLGYPEDELRRLSLADIYAPEQDRAAPRLADIPADAVVLQERQLLRKDGLRFDAEVSFRRTGRGLLQGIIRDITERRRAEAARLGAQKMLERVIASVPGMVYQYVVGPDRPGRFVYVSERARELFGVEAREIVQDPERLLDAVDPGDRDGAAVLFHGSWASPGPESFEFRVRAPSEDRGSGGPRWLRAIATPVREDGSVIWHGVIVDITEQKRLQEDLLQAQKMESLGRLAGGVAHDFNNVLTVIRGYADVLAGQLSGEDPRLEAVQEIRHAADRATSLTRQLLAVSRRQRLIFREVDLPALVADMDRMLRRVLGPPIQVVTQTNPEPVWVRADPGQLEQVLLNLAVNARDAMDPAGGGTLTIETQSVQVSEEATDPATRTVPPGEYVMLRVSDTGGGMDPTVRSKVFEPFFTTKPAGEGTGLGLSIVYGIVQQSHGHITIESAPGQGTSIRIFLPRSTGRLPGLESPAVPAAEPLRGKGTVLVVEDDESVRRLTGRILEHYGFGVVEAEDGPQALELLAAGRQVDALVSDVVMPLMSGPDLAGRIHRERPGLPVLLLSGYTGDEVIETMNPAAGCRRAFLQKPFSPDALATALEELLSDSR